MSLETNEIDTNLENYVNIGFGIILVFININLKREITDEEGMSIFEKVKKAMIEKEEFLKRKTKNNYKKDVKSSSEYSSSSSSSEDEPKKRVTKNKEIIPNPYYMNYFYAPQYMTPITQ
jgi:hypothetical protein